VAAYLEIWQATTEYVGTYVDTFYGDDAAVAGDKQLQKWMAESADADEGNVKGLPLMDNKAALKRVLTSLIYRVTMHGNSRLNNNDTLAALTFVANYPPCLQNSTIPGPDSSFDTAELLAYLPKTGTIGEMINFYFTFAFSAPYETFIPAAGEETHLFYSDGLTNPANQALVKFRRAVQDFILKYDTNAPQLYQWPLNIET
jgi:hypothetical protein